jgi:hypothetical protein
MMDVIVFPPNIMSCHPFSMTGEGGQCGMACNTVPGLRRMHQVNLSSM